MRTLVIRWFEEDRNRTMEFTNVQTVEIWKEIFLSVTCGSYDQRNYSISYFPLRDITYMEFIETPQVD